MLTEAQLEIISDALIPLFQYLEHEVIVDVASRIKNSLTYSRTAEIEAQRLQKLGYSPARIRKEAMKLLNSDAEYRKMVAKNTLEHKKAVKKILREIIKNAQKANADIMKETADLTYLDDLRIWKQGGKTLTDCSYLPQLVDAMRQQTSDELKNLTQTTGFKTMSGFEAVENLYKRELDKAMIKICTGTFSREQVVYDVVHNLANSGLRTIDFASGYSMQLDTAVKLATRTGAHQIMAKVMDANIAGTDENLVYVSKHWGARNEGTGHANHEQWQGKVYYIKDGNDYSEEAKRIGQERITSLWYATGYSADGAKENDPLGLHGYNCRHKHYVWFENISELPKEEPEPKTVPINGKTYDYYKMSQKMRSMERTVRALKREREALNKLGMDTKELNVKIKQRIRDYEQFCDTCKVKPDVNRMRYECGTSDLKKTEAWKLYGESCGAKNSDRNTGEIVHYDEKNDYSISVSGYGKNVNNGLSKAARKVAELGEKDGCEHMYLVDLQNGNLDYYETNGLPNEVGYNFWKKLKENTEKRYAFIHNHNTDGMLSETDIRTLMTEKQIPIMVAVRNDAVIYIAERSGETLATTYYDELYPEEISNLNKLLRDGKITAGERTKLREEMIVYNILRDYTKGGGLIEKDGRKK